MKQLRILRSVLSRTRADKILYVYICFVLIDALVIMIADPAVQNYADALWYCYAVISTAGFGDIVVTSPAARIASVLLTVYSILVIALITGVIVNYYNQLIRIKQKNTMEAFIDRIQRLPELSREELQEMSENARRFLKNNH